MDDVVAKPAERLYDEDFYAWTQAQAQLLRDGRLGKADIANLVEEIESLGRQQVFDLRSRLTVLAQHLLKEIYQPANASRSWALTIVDQRQEIAWSFKDSPSLKTSQGDLFDDAYGDACALAVVETGLPPATFPVEPPFSLAQAIDASFLPGRSLEDRD